MTSTEDKSLVTVTRWRATRSQTVACLVSDLGLTAPPVFVVRPIEQSYLATKLSVPPIIGAEVDWQEALMNDPETLQALYTEFAEQDREMARLGMGHYTQLIQQEESQA